MKVYHYHLTAILATMAAFCLAVCVASSWIGDSSLMNGLLAVREKPSIAVLIAVLFAICYLANLAVLKGIAVNTDVGRGIALVLLVFGEAFLLMFYLPS